MKIYKTLWLVSTLTIPALSGANFLGFVDQKAPNAIVGGCTAGSLGPAYSTSLCNNDGTYKDDIKHVVHHHVFHWPSHPIVWGANPAHVNFPISARNLTNR